MEIVEKLTALEDLLQVTFRDRSLLLRAVTHHSCCPDTAVYDSYDTLEFLGDAIIGAHVVEHIYRAFPHASEGEMTSLKSEVVSRRILARSGQELGLFPYIRVVIASCSISLTPTPASIPSASLNMIFYWAWPKPLVSKKPVVWPPAKHWG